jgi:hypothetical protein
MGTMTKVIFGNHSSVLVPRQDRDGIRNFYAGQEDRIAQVIAGWADTLLTAKTETGEVSKTP